MTLQQDTTWRDITINKALSALPNSAMPHRLNEKMLEELVRIHNGEDHGIATICVALEVVYHGGRELEINDNRTDCVISVYMKKVNEALDALSAGGQVESIEYEEIVADGYDFYQTINKGLFPCSDVVNQSVNEE